MASSSGRNFFHKPPCPRKVGTPLSAEIPAPVSTATELADTLVREKGLAFRTAHAIVARLVKMATAQGLSPNKVGVAILEEAALAVTGHPLGLTEEALHRALDPIHFVQVRRIMGGPAPEATAAVLANVEEALERDRSWLDGEKERLALARAVLDKGGHRQGDPGEPLSDR